MSLLEVTDLTKNFGGLSAVANVNFRVEANERVGLIGPNGAGKTTVFNLLTGVYVPTSGSIELTHEKEKVRLNGKSPYKITNLGLARTFQNIRLFKDLSVLDNVLIAMHAKQGDKIFQSLLRTPGFYHNEEEMQATAEKLLHFFKLDSQLYTVAKNLPYGQQRRLEIVRALATQPKILFLDEPAAGMNPNETAALTQLIADVQTAFHVTIVLIEHDMSLVMKICERIYVLEYGRVIAEGNPQQIQNNPAVIKAYLGGV